MSYFTRHHRTKQTKVAYLLSHGGGGELTGFEFTHFGLKAIRPGRLSTESSTSNSLISRRQFPSSPRWIPNPAGVEQGGASQRLSGRLPAEGAPSG